MHLALKESEPLTPAVLTLHSSTQSGITSTLHPQSHSALIPCTERRPAGRNNQRTGKKKGSFIIQLPVPFGCKRMCFQTCLSLGHRSQSQKGRVPPIGAQPESSLLSLTTYSLSLLPQTSWHSTPTHWLTICFYTCTEKITVWVHAVTTRTQRERTQMLMHAQIYTEWQQIEPYQRNNWQRITEKVVKCVTGTVNLSQSVLRWCYTAE